MLKKRTILVVFVSLFLLTALPLSLRTPVKSNLYAVLKGPVLLSKNAASFFQELWYFRRNAAENRELRRQLGESRSLQAAALEALAENRRLTKLVDIRANIPPPVSRSIAARVIGRSPSTWNRVFLIDKGTNDGVKTGMPVTSESALAGRVVEAWPAVSMVALVTDPNSRVSAVVQRTRQAGILFGTVSGGCRVKYLSVDQEVKKGDLVESAGFGGGIPKGLLIGTVQRAWKEPGQIYQVAEVKPFADLNRLEEVLCLE